MSPGVVAGNLLAFTGQLPGPGAPLRGSGPLIFQEAPEGALALPGYAQVSPPWVPASTCQGHTLRSQSPRPFCRGLDGKAGRPGLGGHVTLSSSGAGSGVDLCMETGVQKHLPPGRLAFLLQPPGAECGSVRQKAGLPVLILVPGP